MDVNELKNEKTDNQIKDGLIVGVPIFLGYMPVALTFGLLAGSTGLHLIEASMMSILVFAGASQFMALTMIGAGTAGLETILATFIVNFRHLLMSASINERLEKESKTKKGFSAFFMTDEVFAVSALKDKPLTAGFLITSGLMAYSSWVMFTVIGYFAGSFIPVVVQSSMTIALYAMFIALLVPSIKSKGRIVVSLAAMGGLFHLLLANWLSTGWSVLFATLLSVSICEWIEHMRGEKK